MKVCGEGTANNTQGACAAPMLERINSGTWFPHFVRTLLKGNINN
jgi:hypothetical protein